MCRWRYWGWENVGSLAFNHGLLSCGSIIHHLWKSCITRWDHLYIYALCCSASQTLSFPILQKWHARQSRLNISLNASTLVRLWALPGLCWPSGYGATTGGFQSDLHWFPACNTCSFASALPPGVFGWNRTASDLLILSSKKQLFVERRGGFITSALWNVQG